VEESPILMLEMITRVQSQRTKQRCELRFSFDPDSIGPYGTIESHWQATLVRGGQATTDYGASLDQAAQRLLDRVQHPEKLSRFI
jgi:hypothetical protein